mmetsp:Transcript_21286/g.18441  ORF Transcript_21286/g.18441 Transcript_21286/m.18441 type:complete len:96 (+) Transcript_21286:84-371(+)
MNDIQVLIADNYEQQIMFPFDKGTNSYKFSFYHPSQTDNLLSSKQITSYFKRINMVCTKKKAKGFFQKLAATLACSKTKSGRKYSDTGSYEALER